MFKLELIMNKDGSWTVYDPFGMYVTAKKLDDLPTAVKSSVKYYCRRMMSQTGVSLDDSKDESTTERCLSDQLSAAADQMGCT